MVMMAYCKRCKAVMKFEKTWKKHCKCESLDLALDRFRDVLEITILQLINRYVRKRREAPDGSHSKCRRQQVC